MDIRAAQLLVHVYANWQVSWASLRKRPDNSDYLRVGSYEQHDMGGGCDRTHVPNHSDWE